jgi:glycosyltransferase involved in cell wall biosynthesis
VNRPLVSLLVAAYNEERHLAGCIRSLQAQTWREIEILVIDDGSTDRTPDVARSFPGVRLLTQDHVGKARAMNWAAREATGEIVFFMDADIEYAPEYVERMTVPIVSGAARGTCHGLEYVANPENPWAAAWQIRAGLPVNIRVQAGPKQIAEGSTIFRAVPRAEFNRVGGFDDTGFLDDQTLAPKLNARALWVPEASCRHYNADRLRDVYTAGRWNSKSLIRNYGRRVLLNHAPPLILWHAVRDVFRYGRLSMFPYVLVNEFGVWSGAIQFFTGRARHFGK